MGGPKQIYKSRNDLKFVESIYIDVSIFREWLVRTIIGRSKDVYYVKFLSEHNEFEKFISVFGIAEIVETLKKEPRVQHIDLTREFILGLIDTLRNTAKIEVIEEEGEGLYKGFTVSPKIVEFTFVCGDLKDSIHVEIAKNNKLLLVTKDDAIGKLKELYPKIIGIRKFVRRQEEN